MITISSTGRRWLQILPLVAVLLLAYLLVPPTKRERPPPLVVRPDVALVGPPNVEEDRQLSYSITISGKEFVLRLRAASPGNDGFRVFHPYGLPGRQRPVHPVRR